MATALAGPRLATIWSPRRIVRIGMIVLSHRLAADAGDGRGRSGHVQFGIALAFVGGGIGLLASQLGNVIQSSVDARARGEAGGLQYTATNLGSSLGTALIGAILLTGLLVAHATPTSSTIRASPTRSSRTSRHRARGRRALHAGLGRRGAAIAAGVPPDEATRSSTSYEARRWMRCALRSPRSRA